MARAAGPVALEHAVVRGGDQLGQAHGVGVAGGERVEKPPVGVAAAVDEAPRERVHEDQRSALANREGIPPEPEAVPESDRGGGHGIERLAGDVRADPGHAHDERVERLLDVDTAELHRPHECLGVGVRRRSGEDGRRNQPPMLCAEDLAAKPGRQHRVDPPQRRCGDVLERCRSERVVAEAAREAGMTERE